MAPTQDWCLQCGASVPGSLQAKENSWRSPALLLGATAILVLGAATAAYAAWGKSSPAHGSTVTVAQAPAATTATPTTPATATTPPPAVRAKAPGIPKTIKPLLPATTVKPPKIPLTPVVPKIPATTTKPSGAPTTSTPSTTTPTTTGGGSTTAEEQPTPITLDTNAASTYNPYGYPASSFGDPSLAIDGEASTAWTAQVNPAVAPKMAVGLAIDLKTAQKLSSVTLVTTTPGVTVQVYGSNASTLPASITDPAWVGLSAPLVVNKTRLSIKLHGSTKAFRFVTLWISKAPAASTPQAPGHVSINEVELFPAS
jgi:hypothetical protein